MDVQPPNIGVQSPFASFPGLCSPESIFEVPDHFGETQIEIPVGNVNSGTVAVMVRPASQKSEVSVNRRITIVIMGIPSL